MSHQRLVSGLAKLAALALCSVAAAQEVTPDGILQDIAIDPADQI